LQLLIANQNEDILNLFDIYFGSQGLNRILADTGAKCLNEVRKRFERFDVIILDTGLYDIRGMEVAKKILELIPDQKIIITTSSKTEELNNEAKSIGIDIENILLKPFRLSTLLSAVKNAISRMNKISLEDHILVGYNSPEEAIEEAIQFFKIGAKNNECVLFVTTKDTDLDAIKEIFISNGLDVTKLLSDNSLIFIENKEWYIPDGRVDKGRIINQWNNLVNQSLNKGKKGLRAFCMMDTFFEHNFLEEMVDYEYALPPRFSMQFLPVCAYMQSDLDKLTDGQRRRMVACHNHVWNHSRELSFTR
jgi:DNA-binding response OmpR family regulator